MKKLINEFLRKFGYTIIKYSGENFRTDNYIGTMELLLADLKIRGLKCDWVIDVGANQADWSAMCRDVFADAKYCLIEPQIELEPYLTDFCNNAKGSIYYIAGAGASTTVKTLSVNANMAGSTFRQADVNVPDTTGEHRDVSIITIDSIIEAGKIAIPQIIKIDVQGYELEVLKGSTKVFGITEVFILEISLFEFPDMPGCPSFVDVVDFMNDKGYVVYDFPGFLRRPLDGALGQCDICFVKRDGMFRASNRWN